MTMRLQGKIAIVTGGASGIGEATARLFAAEGASVLIADVQSEKGEALARELGRSARFMRHDVTRADDWRQVVQSAETAFGPVTVLVNNAGISGPKKPIEDFTDDEYRRVIEVNQFSVFLGIRAIIASMRKAGGGSIINMSSGYGLVSAPNQFAYTAAKFAVTGMSKAAALELGDQGIRVNSIHPGLIRTPIARKPGMSEADVDEKGRRFFASFALKRWGMPDEIAEAILFLASDASSFCTGAAFVVDGGMTAQ